MNPAVTTPSFRAKQGIRGLTVDLSHTASALGKRASLRLVLSRWFPGLHDERLRFCKFRLEPIREVGSAVFEQHDEREREKNEQGEPKQPADQGHAADGTLLRVCGQRARHGALSRSSPMHPSGTARSDPVAKAWSDAPGFHDFAPMRSE